MRYILYTVFIPILVAWYFLPIMHSLPAPTGKYNVATHYIDITIPAEKTNFTARTLPVQIWYPTKAQHSNFEHYGTHIITTLVKNLSLYTYIPEQIIKPFFDIQTHTYKNNLTLSGISNCPILIFSHGFGAHPQLYTSYVQEWTSHGYVVVGITHTGGSFPTRASDGTMQTITDQITDTSSAYQALARWQEDINLVINYLIKSKNTGSDPFKELYDIDKIGCIGHSFGGIAALACSRSNAHIKAIVNLDGALSFDPHSGSRLIVPTLFLLQDYTRPSFLKTRLAASTLQPQEYLAIKLASFTDLCANSQVPCWTVAIKSSGHDSLSDLIFLKYPLSFILNVDIGTRNRIQAFRLINTYVLDFFNTYLQYQEPKLFNTLKQGQINTL